MSDKDTGGFAFPVHGSMGEVAWEGMTLRDYFAVKAMSVVWQDIPDSLNRDAALLNLGRLSYEMADAMLEARK
jgi:hypothetical protein